MNEDTARANLDAQIDIEHGVIVPEPDEQEIDHD